MRIETKEELINYLENYIITYDYEEDYTNIYNACIDYMNKTQNFDFEYLFENFIDYDLAEEIAKKELEDGGLERLYYFMGDCNFNNNLFRINAYGNLEEVDKEDLVYLKEEIIEKLKENEE